MNPELQRIISRYEQLFPGLSSTIHLILSLHATTRLKRKEALAVILVGPPSSGKTTALQIPLGFDNKSDLGKTVIRVDNFTAASFVSHAGTQSSDALRKNDLLPKIKGNCVIAKEMAPLFSTNEDQLQKDLAVFASVLDGMGYVSHSGNHGERGYTGEYAFTWIGAIASDLMKNKTYKVMGRIGPRLCFWEIPKRQTDPLTWRGPQIDTSDAQSALQRALEEYMTILYAGMPSALIPFSEFTYHEEFDRSLSAIAYLLAILRSTVEEDECEISNLKVRQISNESPERAYSYLRQIAQGACLLDKRRELLTSDLRNPLKLAIDSAQARRRELIRTFFDSEGALSAAQAASHLGVRHETATKHLDFFVELGVIERVEIDGTRLWDLKEPFKALRGSVWKKSNP